MVRVKFSESIVIDRVREDVFDLTQDYDKRLLWDTFLKRAELVGGAVKANKYVRAYCVAKNGLGMETEYVSFDRPRVTAIKMTKGPYIFKSFSGSWNFKELDDSKTEVIFSYSFEPRFPISLFSGLLEKNLRSNVKQRLVDLKTMLESREFGYL